MLRLLGGLAAAIGHWVEVAFVNVINALVVAIGAVIGVMMALLPAMPAPPTSPVAPWIGWLNWLIPVAPMVAGLLVFVGLWTAFLVVRIPLRWVRAL